MNTTVCTLGESQINDLDNTQYSDVHANQLNDKVCVNTQTFLGIRAGAVVPVDKLI